MLFYIENLSFVIAFAIILVFVYVTPSSELVEFQHKHVAPFAFAQQLAEITGVCIFIVYFGISITRDGPFR